MKQLIIVLSFLAIGLTQVYAQVPQKISYQSVVRDGDGKLLKETEIGIKTTLRKDNPDGEVVYQEIYNPNPKTNINGLLTFEIGSGLKLAGEFSSIDWSTGSFYIQTEIDPKGGTSYSLSSISPINSVPFALYSASGEREIKEMRETREQKATKVIRAQVSKSLAQYLQKFSYQAIIQETLEMFT
ncbi:MAG: hypothetical protein IPL69_18555 [Saprospiraceae bacterium]|nr:hypothetical protein [Candidatus Brachybacter algidus]